MFIFYGMLIGPDHVASLKYLHRFWKPNWQVFRNTLPNLTVPVISSLFEFLRPEDQYRALQGCTETKTMFVKFSTRLEGQ